MVTKQVVIAGVGASAIAGTTGGIYYFSQDKTTIKDKLTSEKEKLISDKSEYPKVFKAFKDETELTEAISKPNKKITSASTDQEGGDALEAWCNENLNAYLSKLNDQELIKKVKKYCTNAPVTIKDKYTKNGKELVTEWETQLTKIKANASSSDKQLLADLQSKKSEVKNFDQPTTKIASDALKEWCNENIGKKLESDNNGEIWTKVNARCLKEQNDE